MSRAHHHIKERTELTVSIKSLGVVYLAGPMSGIAEYNYPAFEDAAKKLRDLGYIVKSAHEVKHPDNGVPGSITWAEYMRRDIKVLLGCDCICLLPGWSESRGAKLENRIACELGMKPYTLNSLLALGGRP